MLVTITGPAADKGLDAPALLQAIARAGARVETIRYRHPAGAAYALSLRSPTSGDVERIKNAARTLSVAANRAEGAEAALLPDTLDRIGSAYVLTVFQSTASPGALGRILEIASAAGLRTVRIDTLSQRHGWVVEVGLDGSANAAAACRSSLPAVRSELGGDMVLQSEHADRRTKRLLIMDVDSTLIHQEVVDELARAAGVYDRVAAVTARAMNGELAFEASLRERVRTLEGIPTPVLNEVLASLTVTDGAERLVRVIQNMGGRVAVISGGFIQVVEPLRRRLGIDYAFANALAVADGRLTGEVVGPVIDRARKADLLDGLASVHGLQPEATMAIGDGANDLDMLSRAGLGIAFHAKPAVQAAAPACLNQPTMDAALYLLGLNEAEIDALARA